MTPAAVRAAILGPLLRPTLPSSLLGQARPRSTHQPRPSVPRPSHWKSTGTSRKEKGRLSAIVAMEKGRLSAIVLFWTESAGLSQSDRAPREQDKSGDFSENPGHPGGKCGLSFGYGRKNHRQRAAVFGSVSGPTFLRNLSPLRNASSRQTSSRNATVAFEQSHSSIARERSMPVAY